jgi:hypothetical protein
LGGAADAVVNLRRENVVIAQAFTALFVAATNSACAEDLSKGEAYGESAG